MKAAIKKAGVYLISALGALGTALQNYVAVAQLVGSLMSGTFAGTKAGLGLFTALLYAWVFAAG